MSEATPAPPTPRGRLAPVRVRRKQLNPLEALERGFALFRSTFARDAWRYYAGAAPLVFCFIPMWVVNGQIRLSDSTLWMESALLTGAYVLRVWAVASYMQRVRERAFGVPRQRLPGVSAQVAAMGRLLAWKITLSAAVLATLATIAGGSWLYCACQFASLEAREDVAERHSFGGCIAMANQWFGGGLLLFVMLFPLWIAVWVNGFILAIILPQLLHSIFGVNSLLSTRMGIDALLEGSAFWLSLCAGAWLALDPVVKCTFVVVYQHLRSRRDGDDLRGLLASLPREQQKKAELITSTALGSRAMAALFVVLSTILAGGWQTASARAAQAPPGLSRPEPASDSARQARVQKMRQALSEEAQRAIYRWHDAEHPSPPTWFDKRLSKVGDAINRAWNTLRRFLRKMWPRGLHLSPGNEKPGNEKPGAWQLRDLRFWLTLIAILTVAAGAVLYRLRHRRETVQLSIPLAIEPLPDLSDNAVASERSEEEWFTLADRLQREGELRLALRAAYLGLLAGLAQREWLAIRRDRTNREYLEEFTRRWLRRPQAAAEARAEIPEKLRGSLRQFDRVWYGSYRLTPEAVVAYRQDQREFLNHV